MLSSLAQDDDDDEGKINDNVLETFVAHSYEERINLQLISFGLPINNDLRRRNLGLPGSSLSFGNDAKPFPRVESD
jgi:hypothetical protein